MKLVLRDDNNNAIFDTVEQIMELRGVDKERFNLLENPTEEIKTGYINVGNAAIVISAHVMVESNIAGLIDSDTDGFTSMAALSGQMREIADMKDLSFNFLPILHGDKLHGLTERSIDIILSSNIDLLIITDAGSSEEDIEGIKKILATGIEIVVIDHHALSEKINEEELLSFDNLTFVNNHLSANTDPNRNLVGAGMTYRVMQSIDKMCKTNLANNQLDLIALGQIGDASDLSENESRYMVMKGLDHIKNEFLKCYVKKNCLPPYAPRDFSFSFIPLVNAIARVGSIEEHELLFKSLAGIGMAGTEIQERKRKNKTTGKFDKVLIEFTKYELALEILGKVKDRQKKIVEDTMKSIELFNTSNGEVVIGLAQKLEHGSISGLIAAKLCDRYEKSAIMVINNEETECYTGSGRSQDRYTGSLKHWLSDTKLFEFCSGHDNAHGFKLKKDNFEQLKAICGKDLIKKKVGECIITVDSLFGDNDVATHQVFDVYNNRHLFGGTIHYPTFGYETIRIEKRNINARGKVLSLRKNGVEFISFSLGTDYKLMEKLMSGFGDKYVRICGEPSVSNFGGATNQPQIVIRDIEIVEKPLVSEEEEFYF